MKHGFRLRRTRWSVVAAVVVLIVLALSFLAWSGLSDGEGGVDVRPEMTRSEFRSLRLGTARSDVEDEVGKGEGALEFNGGLAATRAAVEPMDASCVYFAPAAFRGVFQLCYRNDELVSKRIYS